MNEQPIPTSVGNIGSHDGTGAGDHDEPYVGFRSYHFGTLQFARLLRLRGELLEARLGNGRWAQDLSAALLEFRATRIGAGAAN